MICPQCAESGVGSIPMDVLPGSAVGWMRPTSYMTEEIKLCPNCGLKVRETYKAEYVPDEVNAPAVSKNNIIGKP